MSSVFARLGMSRDGFVAGPDGGPGDPHGDGGSRIHEWVSKTASWWASRTAGGGPAERDGEAAGEQAPGAGAHVMSRRAFDERETGWLGPPPFRAPVFVLTTSAREPWVSEGGATFTFVTDGIASALEQARAVAEGGDVQVSGGADTVRQFLNAGLLDELEIHFAPVRLGAGVRLFEGVDRGLRLVPVRVTGAPEVTHVRYLVKR